MAIWRAVHGRQQAQAMVEMAFVLPVMIFLVMGALQFAYLSMIYVSVLGLMQDTARWMAISSTAAMPVSGNCFPTGTNTLYPRPHWANGDQGTVYRDCKLGTGGLLSSANFTSWSWSPACSTGSDCLALGTRRPDQKLTLTATYNYSSALFMPLITGGGLTNAWQFPTSFTLSAAEVMQY